MRFSKKSLGQNFLIDKNIVQKIVDLLPIKNKNIIEIGPGKGALSEEILKREPKSLLVIEKDTKLSKDLEIKFKKNNLIKIYNDDILDFDLEKFIKKETIIFGNLPYNISSQILIKILRFEKWPPNFTDLIFMFQKELGEKIIGKFKTKNYGRISIVTSYRLKSHQKFNVSPNCFFPKPKVNSIVINFKPKLKCNPKIKVGSLEKITNIIFSNKRKMINKNIRKIISEEEIKSLPFLRNSLRPVEIDPETYFKITEIYENQ